MSMELHPLHINLDGKQFTTTVKSFSDLNHSTGEK
jgi:hypothetical protein